MSGKLKDSHLFCHYTESGNLSFFPMLGHRILIFSLVTLKLATDLYFGLCGTLLVINIGGCLVSTGYLELQ